MVISVASGVMVGKSYFVMFNKVFELHCKPGGVIAMKFILFKRHYQIHAGLDNILKQLYFTFTVILVSYNVPINCT